MDNTVKVWSLQRETVQAAVRDSYARPTRTDERPFQTCYEQFPVFATSKVHNNYVDCVAWLGSLLVSKSTAHKVALWKPDPRRRRDAVLVLHEYAYADAEIWFMRFALDAEARARARAVSAGGARG